MYRLGLDMEWHPMAHLKGNVYVSCTTLWHYILFFCVTFSLQQIFVLTICVPTVFLLCVSTKTPCLSGVSWQNQPGGRFQLDRSWFCIHRCSFSWWCLDSQDPPGLPNGDDITCVRKPRNPLETSTNVIVTRGWVGWGDRFTFLNVQAGSIRFSIGHGLRWYNHGLVW